MDEALRHQNEEIRSQAVIAMSASGIRSDTTLRVLVEMLGLDSSDYVRLQVSVPETFTLPFYLVKSMSFYETGDSNFSCSGSDRYQGGTLYSRKGSFWRTFSKVVC